MNDVWHWQWNSSVYYQHQSMMCVTVVMEYIADTNEWCATPLTPVNNTWHWQWNSSVYYWHQSITCNSGNRIYHLNYRLMATRESKKWDSMYNIWMPIFAYFSYRTQQNVKAPVKAPRVIIQPGGWLTVTCRLTACTPGSAPGPTLGIEYGKPLPFLPFMASMLQKIIIIIINTKTAKNVHKNFVDHKTTKENFNKMNKKTDPSHIFHEVNSVVVAHTLVHCTEVTTRSCEGLSSLVFHTTVSLFQPNWRLHIHCGYQLSAVWH